MEGKLLLSTEYSLLSEPINLKRNPWLIGQGFNALGVCLEMGMPSHFEKEVVAWIDLINLMTAPLSCGAVFGFLKQRRYST